ncbi:hypothetical protein ACFYS8_13810 [Kitasatospora sp. NPDC004615]|uniref:hypothetical protein n=1 Tax=Kitasatospora sp. NPDC004615 TaxID=3364017 RepID=UPI003693DE6A
MIHAMQPWNTLSPAEQTLMRRGLWQSRLAGTVQQYGIDLRWAGAKGASPLRSYTLDEQRALVPQLAPVALGLVGRGLLTVRIRQGTVPSDPVLTGPELRDVLAEPANWLWSPNAAVTFGLDATESAREWWHASALPAAVGGGLPSWDELTREQQEVLVCAAEASGMLTGPFGIWEDLPTELAGVELSEWVDRQLAPLLPYVREGWIEVRHFPVEAGEAFTVIPLDDLRTAFADRSLRYDDGDDWGVGLGCVFTYRGLAVWRSGSSAAWGSRLTFD